MKLVVCDDDLVFLSELKSNINCACQELQVDITIIPFSSGEEFLKYYQEVKDFDIIFLDIKMKDVNGVQVAKKIRETDRNIQIFFLTSLKNYVLEGYNVNAANYLLKPITYSKLKSELEKAIATSKENNSKFIIEKNDNGIYKIYLDEIIYIETFQRNTMIHTKDAEILSYKNMKQHLLCLDNNNFYRIHESYIVNLAYVNKVKKLEIELSKSFTFMISKNRKKKFMEKLSEYYGTIL